MSMLNEAQIEINSGIGSRREIMERLGKVNIPKILGEIEEDDSRKTELQKSLQPEPPQTGGLTPEQKQLA